MTRKSITHIHLRRNLVFAVIMGFVLCVTLASFDLIGDSNWPYWLIPAVIISLPIPLYDNVYSLWGGSASGDVTSLFGIYQDAGRDAQCLIGLSLFQRAGDNAYIVAGISLYQEAGFGTQVGSSVIGYRLDEHMSAQQWLTISLIQRANLDAYQAFGISIYQKAFGTVEQLIGMSLYQSGHPVTRGWLSFNVLPHLGHPARRQ